mgnify:CR=1 FL=1
MRIYLTLLLIIVTTVVSGQESSTYKNEGFEVSYSKDWLLDTSGQMNSKFILFSKPEPNDKFQENVNLIVQDLSGKGFTMESYVKLSKKQIETMVPEGEILVSKNMNSYHMAIWKGRIGANLLKFKQYYFLKNEKVYVLTFTALPDTYDRFIETGNKILDSFKLK